MEGTWGPYECGRQPILWDHPDQEDGRDSKGHRKAELRKSPYEKKAAIIRAAKLPKALYGCEVAPANERALRTLRTSIAKCLTFTTSQRSADLTFATASAGPDLDPDVSIFSRRAVAFRRFMSRGEGNVRMMEAILQRYRQLGEPGIHVDEEQLRNKQDGGDPGTKGRAKVRGQCKPKGPCGYLLESIHLQAATLDGKYRIKQANQQTIELVSGPAQQIIPLTTRMAARNRTMRPKVHELKHMV